MQTRGRVTLRSATGADVRRLHALIARNQEEGHLLPRTLDEIGAHAERFVVAERGRRIVACAELAPLSAQLAEIRSLAVDASSRRRGIGARLVDELGQRARRDGFERLCAFTHRPGYFSRMGFSIVPHLWLAEKVFTDCVKCPLFRRCGQYAMLMDIDHASDTAERESSVTLRTA
jgi:amino-acid N-acetyltransferase